MIEYDPVIDTGLVKTYSTDLKQRFEVLSLGDLHNWLVEFVKEAYGPGRSPWYATEFLKRTDFVRESNERIEFE